MPVCALTATTGSRRLTCAKKSASQRAKALRLRWDPRKQSGLTSRKNTRGLVRSDGAPSLPARSLRECLADGGALETAEVEVEGEEEAMEAGVATRRSARDLWGVATPAAVTGDAATAPTAGSGNASDVGFAPALVAAAVVGKLWIKGPKQIVREFLWAAGQAQIWILGQKPMPFSWAISC